MTLDWTIHNQVAWYAWLLAAFIFSSWFYRRSKEAVHTLFDQEPKPSPDEASAIYRRMIGLAFLISGIVLGLFLVLDLLF